MLSHSELPLHASSLAFISILSLAPTLALVVFISAQLGSLAEITEQLRPLLWELLAPGTNQKLMTDLDQAIARIESGALGTWSLAILILTASRLLYDFDLSMAKIWDKYRTPRFFKRFHLYIMLIILGPLSLSLSVAALGHLEFDQLLAIPFRAVAVVVGLIFLAFTYWLFGNAKKSYSEPLIAAFLATFIVFIAQGLFAYAAKNLLYYNKVYGSLASILLFLLWLWIFWFIVLFCASTHRALVRGRYTSLNL